VLRRVPLDEAEWRRPDFADIEPETPSGNWETVVYEAGLWCLKTSTRRRFSEVEAARDALLMLARRKITLGSLLPKNTVLTLQPDGRGRYWLWSVAPWLSTLKSELDYAKTHDNAQALADPLRAYASAVVLGLKAAARRDVCLDIHPSSFARAGEHVYYVVDDLAGNQRLDIGRALLTPVEHLTHHERELDIYLNHLVEGLHAELTELELSTLGVRDALQGLTPSTPSARSACRRLVAEVA